MYTRAVPVFVLPDAIYALYGIAITLENKPNASRCVFATCLVFPYL